MSMNSVNKKYPIQAKRCIKGEAFFESIISEYAIPHHVVGAKDLGIDYFCEWVHLDNPTGVQFAVQVKTFSTSSGRPKFEGINDGKNSLETYKISNTNLKINAPTLWYWRALSIPVFLFAIAEDSKNNQLIVYYKRYTPKLIKKSPNIPNIQKEYCNDFYKVSSNYKFLAFADNETNSHGFARDLFIDYMRCLYSKGSIAYLNPRALGLNQFPDSQNIFPDLFEDYKEEIGNTYNMLKSYFEKYLDNKNAEKLSDNDKGFSTLFTGA